MWKPAMRQCQSQIILDQNQLDQRTSRWQQHKDLKRLVSRINPSLLPKINLQNTGTLQLNNINRIISKWNYSKRDRLIKHGCLSGGGSVKVLSLFRGNEMKWNEMKWNEMKWNEMKWNEMKWNVSFGRIMLFRGIHLFLLFCKSWNLPWFLRFFCAFVKGFINERL